MPSLKPAKRSALRISETISIASSSVISRSTGFAEDFPTLLPLDLTIVAVPDVSPGVTFFLTGALPKICYIDISRSFQI